jgi:hypothetical protein
MFFQALTLIVLNFESVHLHALRHTEADNGCRYTLQVTHRLRLYGPA